MLLNLLRRGPPSRENKQVSCLFEKEEREKKKGEEAGGRKR